MAKYGTSDIRNIALVGHGAAGKTTLAEAMLFRTKATSRVGSVRDGTSVLDYEAEEKERKNSIDAAIGHCSYKGKEIQIVDTPGYPDFVAEAIAALAVVDAVVVCVDGQAGVRVNTRKVWSLAAERSLPRLIVLTRFDQEHAKLATVLDDIRGQFGDRAVPLYVPRGEGLQYKGNELVFPLAKDASEAATAANQRLVEAAVEGDEALLERYLGGETIPPEELKAALVAAFRRGDIYPIIPVAGEKDLIGVDDLLATVADLCPSPADRKVEALEADGDGEAGKPVAIVPDGPFTARVFKTIYDPFVGKLSYLRVFSGQLPQNATVANTRSGGSFKVAHIYRLQGKEQQEIPEAQAGDLVAFAKIEDLQQGDALCTPDLRVAFPPLQFPKPMVSLAVEPKSRGDEAKLSGAIAKLADQDPTFKVNRDRQTGELVITGMSNLHLDVVLSRMKRRFQVEVVTRIPKVPYLETITARGDAKYRHKKQTGGAGQFAEVWMRIEPQARGVGFEFESEVVGGAISQSFIPSIEKGVRHVMEKGVIAGFPVVDVKAIVYDGKEHPVDSKDIAFQVAGRQCFKLCVQQAKPVLLEPIVEVEITVPQDAMGAIMGDLNGRRGRIVSTDTVGNFAAIKATIPQSELMTYSTELRSMTGGEGSYTMKPSHYDVVPAHIAQQVIAQYKKVEEKEED